MFEWKVEELKLMNERGGIFLGSERIFACESETSREDKIAFVDSVTNGQLSYILSLIEKFNEDSGSSLLRIDTFGNIAESSKKSWLLKNDNRREISCVADCGSFNVLGCCRNIEFNIPTRYDTFPDLVDECFHRLIKTCYEDEKKYFEQHDEWSILQNLLRERMEQYKTTFGAKLMIVSSSKATKPEIMIGDETGRRRSLSIDEMKDLLSMYSQLDKLIEELTAEKHISY